MTSERDLYSIKMNHRRQGPRSFRSRVIVRTHSLTDTHTHTVVGKNPTSHISCHSRRRNLQRQHNLHFLALIDRRHDSRRRRCACRGDGRARQMAVSGRRTRSADLASCAVSVCQHSWRSRQHRQQQQQLDTC